MERIGCGVVLVGDFLLLFLRFSCLGCLDERSLTLFLYRPVLNFGFSALGFCFPTTVFSLGCSRGFLLFLVVHSLRISLIFCSDW
jgi:hypothetical protein